MSRYANWIEQQSVLQQPDGSYLVRPYGYIRVLYRTDKPTKDRFVRSRVVTDLIALGLLALFFSMAAGDLALLSYGIEILLPIDFLSVLAACLVPTSLLLIAVNRHERRIFRKSVRVSPQIWAGRDPFMILPWHVRTGILIAFGGFSTFLLLKTWADRAHPILFPLEVVALLAIVAASAFRAWLIFHSSTEPPSGA